MKRCLLVVRQISLLAIFLQFSNTSILSQSTAPSFEVDWSEYNDAISSNYVNKYFTLENGDVLFLSVWRNYSSGILTMRVFDPSLIFIEAKVKDLKDGQQRFNYLDVIQTPEGIFLISSLKNNRENSIDVYAEQLDEETLLFEDRKKIISFSGYVSLGETLIQIKSSAERARLLVFFNPYSKAKNEQPIQFGVFDEALNLVWSRETSIDVIAGAVLEKSMWLDDAGQVFFLARHLLSGKKAKKKREYPLDEAKFTLYSFKQRSEIVDQVDLDFGEGLFISNVDGKSLNGDILLPAYYTDAPKGSLKGFCYFRLNPTDLSLIKKVKFDLGKEKLITGPGLIPPKPLSEIRKTIYFRDLISFSDGSFILFAESIMDWPIYDNSPYRAFIYRGINILAIGADGEIGWVQKIPRDFTQFKKLRIDPGTFSYALRENEINVFYNNYSAVRTDMIKVLGSATYSMTDKENIMARIELNGDMDLFSMGLDEEYTVEPALGYHFENDSFILYGWKNKLCSLGILQLP